jgi:hypothetical protein
MQSHSQEIMDYRLIQMGYDPEKFGKFISDINAYLKKGYTLKGPIKSIGSRLSQVVIKCASSEPVVERYHIVGIFGENQQITLERAVLDLLRDGWSLYGDHDYSKYSSDNSYTWQALVKYTKSTENPFDTI